MAGIEPDRAPAYCHLLGLYLGDGSIVARTNRLEIVLDKAYPSVIDGCVISMRAIHPRGKAAVRERTSCVVVSSYDKSWPALLPQTGSGPKHRRPIRLTPEQQQIITGSPLAFIRGLIESDGCRFDWVVGGRAYPAYEFTNVSVDIIEIFCWAADLVGLHYTRSRPVAVSIARRADVQFLDVNLPRKNAGALRACC